MKKFYLLLSAVMTLVMSSLPVFADDDTATFRWSEPGSVNFYKKLADKATGTAIALPEGATQFQFDGDDLFVAPAEGYIITAMKATDGSSITIRPGSYQEKYGQALTVSYGSLWGKTYDITVEKIVRDKKLNVKVVNGAEYINAKFREYWIPVTLTKGNNEVPFSSKFETSLAIQNVSGTSIKKIYQVKRNGTAVDDVTSPGYSYFELKNLTENDQIEIRVFEEDDEPEIETCELTVSIAAGIEDCIKSIFNKSTGKFIIMTGNKLTVDKGNQIQFNFNEDITFTSFKFGGKDVTSTYVKDGNRIVVTADADATLEIAGAPTVYNDIEFTVYVMNPQGARLRLGEPYSLNEGDLSEGEAITQTFITPRQSFTNISGITTVIPSVEMTPENTRKFKVKVSEKRPVIFVSPQLGYYINGVFDSQLKESIDYVEASNRVFYVVALPLNRVGKATVVVDSDDDVRLVPSAGLSMLWMNPASTFGIAKGTNEITFDPTYHTPFTFRIIPRGAGSENFDVEQYELFLDGLKLTPDENGNFPVDFALPEGYDNGWQQTNTGSGEDGEGDGGNQDSPYTRAESTTPTGSTLHAYAIGATAPSCGFSVTRSDDYKLDVFYSDLRRPAPDSFSAEQGTKVTVRPEKDAAGYLLKIGNDIIYGWDDIDEVFVNKLTDGEYTMTAPKVGGRQITIAKDTKAPSAVAEIEAADAADAEIFNLQGISVGKDFDTLPAGIYIRNGKKTIKRN